MGPTGGPNLIGPLLGAGGLRDPGGPRDGAKGPAGLVPPKPFMVFNRSHTSL
jgi:hypothetical protein